eukprot:sb/3473032/
MTQPRLGNPAPVSLVPNKFVKTWYRNMVPLWCSFNIHSDEKNELLSRRLKLWIPRMSTHTNIVTKYQSDRSYDLGDIRLGVPHVFFGPGGLAGAFSNYFFKYIYCNSRTPIYRDNQGNRKGFCPVNRGTRYIGVIYRIFCPVNRGARYIGVKYRYCP